MTINIHELDEYKEAEAIDVPRLNAVETAQIVLSHAVTAQIVKAGLVATQAPIATNASATEMVTTLVAGIDAAAKVSETIQSGLKVVKEGSKEKPVKLNPYQAAYRSYLQSMIEELLAQLDELERTGYANWAIIGLVVAKLNSYAEQLHAGVILPLERMQDVDKAHSKLKAIIEKIQAKMARGDVPSDEDAKDFADAVKELKQAVEDFKSKLPQDNLGQPIYPNDAYKDLVERLEQNLNQILKQELANDNTRSVEDILDSPEELKTSLKSWAEEASRGKGPFKEWEEGKSGFTTLRLELGTIIDEFSDKLNRNSQMLTSLNSVAQKQIELVSELLRTFTSNQISR